MDTHSRQDLRERVREAVDFPALVAKTVPLLRPPEGQQPVMALCPYHEDGNPSLAVYRDHAFCFACQQRWDAFGWLMRRDDLDFRTALDRLAEEVGLGGQPAHQPPQKPTNKQEPVEQVLALAAGHYHARLWETPEALQYARSRGWSDDAIRAARLGYADGRLVTVLRQQRTDLSLARQAGLLRDDDRDHLAGRLVFPFLHSGQVVYMTGRAIESSTKPKYLHLPLAAGRTRPLYGIDALQGNGPLLVVEGPADVVTLGQWQVPAVALLGTSLAEEYVTHLQRHKTIYLALDRDEAGRRATERLAETLGPLVRCLRWPDGVLDANDYAVQGGTRDCLRDLLDQAPSWLDLRIEEVAALRGAERDEAIERLFPLLAGLDPLPLARYRTRVTKALEEVGAREFGRLLKAARPPETATKAPAEVLEGQFPVVAPALDFLDGLAIVTIPLLAMVDGSPMHLPYLITSDRQMLPVDGQPLVKIGERQVVLRDPPTALGSASRWSYAHVREYLGNETPDPVEAYLSVEYLLNKYVDFREEGTSDVLALWIIGSYLYPLFEAYPYLALTGPKGSGKTKTLDLIARLAFNGRVSSNMSPASLFRVVQATRGMLGIDEAEQLSNPRHPATADLRLLLNAGYKRGSPAIRCEGDDHRVVEFEVYGPKVIASIRGLEDVLESRCILIHMLRTTGARGNLILSEEGEDWAWARHRLYCFALQHFAAVRQHYLASTGTESLSNRPAELWRPLLAIAACLEDLGATELLEKARSVALHKTEEANESGLDDWRVALLLALHRLAVTEQKHQVIPGEVCDAMAPFLDESDDVTSQWVGYRLREFGFQRSRRAGKRFYEVDPLIVRDVLDRYGVEVS